MAVVKIRNKESLNKDDGSGDEKEGRGWSCEIFRGTFELDSSHSSQRNLLQLLT